MSPSARSRSALLGTSAARAAAHNAQPEYWGRGGSNSKAHQPAGWRGARPGYQRPDKQKALRAPRKSRCLSTPPISKAARASCLVTMAIGTMAIGTALSDVC
jgi:hypothetical protein